MSQRLYCRVALLPALLAVAMPQTGHAQIEVRGATITEVQEAMTSGAATSAEITAAYLARIRAYDQAGPRIGSMIWINPNAVAEAEALDRERATGDVRGPMHGVPIILKDNYDTYDLPTSGGTLALAGNIPPDDGFQVAKLRAAGAVIIGKSNMHELASGITTISSLGGQTLNPYDLRRNPGGSSGGTGAAITASFATVGWGSDTCGSIRIPSAQNNLVGLRPTKGVSSIDGIIPLAHTQDVGGPLARTMRDLAIALDATVGPDPADPATRILDGRDAPRFVEALDANALQGARIGILEAFFGDAPEEAAAARLVRDALARMVELGADTVTVAIPDYDSLAARSGVIAHEFKWDLIDYLAGVPDAPVASLEDMLRLGLIHRALVPTMLRRNAPENRVTEAYSSALAKREPLRDAVVSTMNRHSLDAIVFPTIRTIPSIVGDPQRGSNCSLSANTGLPALSIPVGFTGAGLPIGMEMVGRTLDDARLVAIGYAFEQATEHRREPASTPALVSGAAPASVLMTVRGTGEEYSPVVASGVVLRARLTLDPAPNTLAYEVTVTGVEAQDIYAVVLRHADDRGNWLVAERLSGPGVAQLSGTIVLSRDMRARLDTGDLLLEALTRDYPFGAARATLRLPR